MQMENRKIKYLRDYLMHRILNEIPDVIVTGNRKFRLSNNASFCFKGITGEAAAILLDTQGTVSYTHLLQRKKADICMITMEM